MTYINQKKYYANDGVNPTDSNWGSYQYVTLEDIVKNFQLMYAGNHALVNNVNIVGSVHGSPLAIDIRKTFKLICDGINWYLTGSEPCRQFIVSFNTICQYSCTSLQSRHMIVLSETSNFIDVISLKNNQAYYFNYSF